MEGDFECPPERLKPGGGELRKELIFP